MPSYVKWDTDERKLIRAVYHGEVVFQDYYDTIDMCYELVRSVAYDVYTTVEFTEVTSRPWYIVEPLRYAGIHMPDNLAGSLVVGVRAPTASQMFVRMVQNMGIQRLADVWIVNTLEEARQLAVKLAQGRHSA